MQIKDICTKDVIYVNPDTSLADVARHMKDKDCGSILVGENEKLTGVITDRDIVLRCVAEGKDPANMNADECKTPEVLYCSQDDNAEDVLQNMAENKVRRMVVLNNLRDKEMVGIVSFGDCSAACNNKEVAGETMRDIYQAA